MCKIVFTSQSNNMLLLSENQLAPQNVVELVRCKCNITKCKTKKHCACKRIGVNSQGYVIVRTKKTFVMRTYESIEEVKKLMYNTSL